MNIKDILDRQQITDLLLTEQECYQATIAYAHRLSRKVQRGTHAGDKALCEAQIQKMLDTGYTRSAEPSEKQVEAVVKTLKAVWLAGHCIREFKPDEVPVESLQNIARSILKLQPEPAEKMVEAVKKKLTEIYNWGAGAERAGYYDPEEAQEAITRDACEILKLFPEYEPVELKVLGEAEINKAIFEQRQVLELNGHKPTTMDSKKAVMFATIQKNQAKGQLYRRSEKEWKIENG